ncbi:hypothetical protein NQ176_g9013 [Zarea fungicola]|uniref:Uncharacterized protein n=1 Tax=Zarea fungicola TaxID=93591 RepID=A0ACC1MP43_9HYPO|nr:hypothetical protein NQ176_g9013 [Lecanicillium fungicola]
MVWFDDAGVKHEIYIPARDFYKAMEHSKKNEWDELAKFPKWDNQGYSEADNLNNITDVNKFYSVPPPQDDDDDDGKKPSSSADTDAKKKE